MIDLKKPDSSDCTKCGDDFYHCHCNTADTSDHEHGCCECCGDEEYDDDDLDEVSAFERSFKHLVTTTAGVVLCVAGVLGSMGHIDHSGWLIFIGAMLLL